MLSFNQKLSESWKCHVTVKKALSQMPRVYFYTFLEKKTQLHHKTQTTTGLQQTLNTEMRRADLAQAVVVFGAEG